MLPTIAIHEHRITQKISPMSQPTRAIVFADRLGRELAPLHQRNCIAMFPIATKPLLDYVLEKLLSAGIRQVLVVISSHAAGLRAYMNLGERWGVELRYILSRGEENPALIMQRLGKRLAEDDCLVLRGDILRHLNLQDFLQQAQHQQHACTLATINGQFAGVAYLRRQVADHHPHSFAVWQAAEVVNWDRQAWQTLPQHYPCIEMEGQIALLDSLQNYQQANFAVLRGEFSGVVLPCRHLHQQLQAGYRSEYSQHHHGVIGTDCSVATNAELQEAIVCNGVVVDHSAVLRKTIVLPNTYIGVGVSLQDAVVWGDLIIHPSQNAIQASPQRLLVADLNRENLLKQLARLLHRGVGILALLLSLPLWVVAAVVAWREQGRVLCSVQLLSNGWSSSQQRQTFRSWEFATNIRALRYLPLLLGVASGKLRLVGVMPRDDASADCESQPWLLVCQYAPMGILGPRQLLNQAMPLQEQQLIEAHFAVTRRFSRDLLWVVRGISWFFSKAAWKTA